MTKIFLEGAVGTDTPTSCRSYGNFNHTMSSHPKWSSTRNSRNTSVSAEQRGKKKHNYQASPRVKEVDPKQLHFALF